MLKIKLIAVAVFPKELHSLNLKVETYHPERPSDSQIELTPRHPAVQTQFYLPLTFLLFHFLPPCMCGGGTGSCVQVHVEVGVQPRSQAPLPLYLKQGLLLAAAYCILRLAGLWTSRGSPVSASHLAVGMLGSQMLATIFRCTSVLGDKLKSSRTASTFPTEPTLSLDLSSQSKFVSLTWRQLGWSELPGPLALFLLMKFPLKITFVFLRLTSHHP